LDKKTVEGIRDINPLDESVVLERDVQSAYSSLINP
jgi:hypothetical protein